MNRSKSFSSVNRVQFFRLKNAMVIHAMIANLIGAGAARVMGYLDMPEMTPVFSQLHFKLLPFTLLAPTLVTLFYERPIRRFFDEAFLDGRMQQEPPEKVKRRLLNEPFFQILLAFAVWSFVAVFHSGLFVAVGAAPELVRSAFFVSIFTGLITVAIEFFLLEFILQRQLAPHFFPDGNLHSVPGTISISIRKKLLAMVLACNLVPFFAVILTVNEPAGLDSPALAARMRLTLTIMSFLFMVVGLYLVFLVSANFTRPLKEIVRALDRVRRGNLDTRVKVVTNDELGYTGDMINAMNEGLRERDLVKETFGKYVSAEVRDEILSGRLALEGEVKEATVLFADLRDFTQMVEKTPPREVVRILNRYFEKMEAAVQANDGLVLQYIGDEIEAVFGAPLHRDGHPAMAVQAALQMRGHLDELNRDLLSEGHMPLSHGIGIHTGSILAASIGSPNRLSYAMIGDTVNLAARLQGLNKITGTEILVSAATYERIGKDCGFRALPPVSIKGKTEEIAVYGIASEQAFV